ncbi:MAG: class II aldolase/adducin family protein [Gemmatimonadetes bacterium]|nr:MAG: class II aldolase/adducin family protein [Gemmatimonadota bacterium]
MSEAAADQIVACCNRLWMAGLMAGLSGNVSVRLGDDRFLVTPGGLAKSDLRPEDLVEVDGGGRRVRGFQNPTSELDLHLRIYRESPACGAVVHAHPPTATAFGIAGETIDTDVLPEVVLLLGEVPLAPYAGPGTPALGDQVARYVAGHTTVLLANHGAVCWGPDLATARARMETLEHAAKIIHSARSLGRVNRLTREQRDELDTRRRTPRNG